MGLTIQTADEQGHDSQEDTNATSDLVTKKVEDQWREMVKEGWKWESDKLVRPVEESEPSETAPDLVQSTADSREVTTEGS